MKYSPFVFVCILILSSCASMKPIRPDIEQLSYPKDNETTTKYVGDILLSQGSVEITDGLEMLFDYDGDKITKGLYKKIGTQQGFYIYEPVASSGASIRGPLQGGVYFLARSIQTGAAVFCAYGGYGNVFILSGIPSNWYKDTKVHNDKKNALQQTLVYTGKENNIVKFSYREFSGELARPAFTIDVTHDLNSSDEIAFRNAQLKILSATNKEIVYRVLHNF